MSYGAGFALLSLLCAGINDVVFKKYTLKKSSLGIYICGIGVVWTIAQVLFFRLQGGHFVCNFPSIGFGLAAGIFVTLSNLLLLESLTRIDVSAGSTIYRLNTIGVVVLSFILLDESLGFFKMTGIIAGIMAVFFLYQKNDRANVESGCFLFYAIAVAASLLRAFYGITTKAGLLNRADMQTMLVLISSSWIVGGAAYAFFREKNFTVKFEVLRYALLSGMLVLGVANFLMLAVKYGEASIVIPIANMSFIIALLLSAGLKMESITLRKCGVMALAVVSIVMLAQA
ncbi:MAG: EamA family transporter [Deltaproteobacteria bacterium]|nr:EamA family transporter [Deltaproteobacteria bacterium]